MKTNIDTTILGLDVGERRLGVARIHSLVRIAEPLLVIDRSKQDTFQAIKAAIVENIADAIVVGLPRGLDGQETNQTLYCQDFAHELASEIKIPVYMIDEAGTSKAADDRIGNASKISQDSMAAAILLEDFVNYPNKELLRVKV